MTRWREGIGVWILVGALAHPGMMGIAMAAQQAQEENAAAQAESSSPTAADLEASLKQASGRIAAVNAQERMVTLKKWFLPFPKTTFAVDWRTSITDNGRRMSLAELRPGRPVDVEYTVREGKKVARSISLRE